MIETETGATPGPVIRPLGQPGDLGWMVQAHGEIYAAEFGWDSSFETLVAQIVTGYASEHDPESEAAWIATLDGERVGCVLCSRGDAETAKLRILLVDPKARGYGLGRRLVTTCLDFARSTGYRRITLWTNDVLTSARRIYRATGFELDDEYRHHSFGRELVGQNWSREL
ncbi:GNAT family N-acetyltransferase [Nocardia sp. NPDC004568]|uniref:GNAT family N-acetyltransferase n=1 Tax=Nocardia sp. NPDC004568 TaxID=3154551 RepID=UPI0033BAC4FF